MFLLPQADRITGVIGIGFYAHPVGGELLNCIWHLAKNILPAEYASD
jgi:hypothetical protein